MRIEVLCEDKSSVPILQKILGDELGRRKQVHELAVHPHRGKGKTPHDLNEKPKSYQGGLLHLLPAKLRAYERLAGKLDILLVVVLDIDRDDLDELYQSLEYQFRTLSPSRFFVIGICVEETESWLLGDEKALFTAYPEADRKIYRGYVQDSICGTWEVLASVLEGRDKGEELEQVGYPAVGIFKSEWAERIAPYMSVEANRSPSFHKFISRFNDILTRAEERAAEAHD